MYKRDRRFKDIKKSLLFYFDLVLRSSFTLVLFSDTSWNEELPLTGVFLPLGILEGTQLAAQLSCILFTQLQREGWLCVKPLHGNTWLVISTASCTGQHLPQASVFTPPQFFHPYPEPVVLCPLFTMPPQSCSHVRRSCGWPWAPFPAFSRGRMVICRAWLCLRSFLGLAGNLMVFNLLEHMCRQWLGVKEGMIGCG